MKPSSKGSVSKESNLVYFYELYAAKAAISVPPAQ